MPPAWAPKLKAGGLSSRKDVLKVGACECQQAAPPLPHFLREKGPWLAPFSVL